MKLCYFLAAIGEPMFLQKKFILLHNLNKIHEYYKDKIDIFVNCYDSKINFDFLEEVNFIDNIFIHTKEKGILAELWFSNNHLDKLKNYDYIIFSLDDVKFNNFNIYDIIKVKEKYNLILISPAIDDPTHSYMEKKFNSDNSLALTNCLEFYTYVLTPNDFKKYLSLLDKNHKNIWGVDLLYGYHKVKTGIYYKYVVDHFYRNGTSSILAKKEMIKYLEDRGFYNDRDGVEKYYGKIIYEKIKIKK